MEDDDTVTNGRTITTLLAIVVSATVAASIGCGRSGPDRVVVTGTVKYNGTPIESGKIRFIPTKGTMAPMSGSVISNGQYRVDAKGGVPVGTHRIEIVGHRVDPRFADAAVDPGVESELPKEQYIPKKYNENSELEITVTAQKAAITKDFDLPE